MASTNVSSNLFVVLFAMFSIRRIMTLLIKPLNIKKLEKFLGQLVFERYL